jgi:hypothetical protein
MVSMSQSPAGRSHPGILGPFFSILTLIVVIVTPSKKLVSA